MDWNLENFIAVALGSAAYIWNGRTLQGIESIDLNSSSKYISSLAWIKEGTCLAVGTSDGEVQVLNILFFCLSQFLAEVSMRQSSLFNETKQEGWLKYRKTLLWMVHNNYIIPHVTE